jgi:GDP-L-fucose synthase
VKILVTGGTGLVGKALQDVAKYYKHEFTFLSSKDCDLLDSGAIDAWVNSLNPQAVIHLAANVGGLFKNMNKKVAMFEDNIEMNTNVLKACSKNGVQRFVGMLSTCIFPDNTTYPISESMVHDGPPHDSNDSYAYAKRMLDVHCKAYRDQYGLKYNCIIPTNIYGENDNYNLEDSHVIPALIHKCHIARKTGKPFMVFGSGKPLRQFIYAKDLARGIIDTLDVHDSNIIISPRDEHSIGSVATRIAENFDMMDALEFDESKSDGQYKKTADNSKFMGLNPNFKFTSIDVGLSKTIQYFLENFEDLRT